jgi:hypothetical protein
MVAKEVADQQSEETKVKAVGESSSAGVKAYALTLPNDGGDPNNLTQPKDIQRFDASTFSWDGGDNYADNPDVQVWHNYGSDSNPDWEAFANQSGEVPVTLKYPESSEGTYDPAAVAQGIVGYHTGTQEWRWTATFEAFVSQFPLIDMQGNTYTATPPGEYRFVVHGNWRQSNVDTPYTRTSRTFTVSPWSGIAVDSPGTDSAGHVTFSAGPTHTVQEMTMRSTSRTAFNYTRPDTSSNWTEQPYPFTIGPVDFPDAAADQAATGARFLNHTRGYSGSCAHETDTPTKMFCDQPDEVEHYCLDCTFRPWLDATNQVTADVTIGGKTKTIDPVDDNGRFVTGAAVAPGQAATIVIHDAWGDTSAPATVTG